LEIALPINEAVALISNSVLITSFTLALVVLIPLHRVNLDLKKSCIIKKITRQQQHIRS
jgi:hypothetical protein